jgi:VCBS repeat-containing protein
MTPRARRFAVPALGLLLAACVLVPAHVTVSAGNPHGAYYSSENTSVFWFLHVSDLHVGACNSGETDRLRWLVTTARSTINPQFIVATGDLTDSTNCNWLGYPNGPYQVEWSEYKSIVDGAGAGAGFFYDLPGNHDAYSDQYFEYYLANSVQGRATGKTQASWTRQFAFGTYHFLGVNTADNTGDGFSILPPYGDHAGLDSSELAYINQALDANSEADLTFVFGHHPVTSTGNSSDTYLYYGHQAFISALDQSSASAYNYGHTHANSQVLFTGNSYTGLMGGDGIQYNNVSSLGKDSPNSYSLVAVDCNGVSSVTKTVGSWPVVLITAPVDRYVGSSPNPYAYTVPNSSANAIRALVFDTGAVVSVSYRIDGGGTWYPMTQVASNTALWETRAWNASALANGDHTIEVRAAGTTTVSDSVTVSVTGQVNRAPVAAPDSYTTAYNTALSVAASGVLANDTDADGDALTATVASGPAHGTLTLNTNGSFTYTPASAYSGGDSFTYTASDGAARSAAATVTITVAAPPSADTVTITSATYAAKTKRLTVQAKSSAQPTAVLTVVGYGTMTYNRKSGVYTLQATSATKPATVTVRSSLGGSATRAVT